MLPSSERARWALIVAVGLFVLAAIHAWWIATYRHGYPLDVDEAGYLGIGVTDYIGFQTDGLSGWWDAFQSQTPNAPLVPALTSVLLLVKPGVLEGFGVLIGFLVLLVLATYAVGERLASPRLGALAALVAGTGQGAFVFTREYVFALPVAALLMCAVYGLLRSEGLRSRRWLVLAGIALGLMVMARTMAVAFVPGVFLAALALGFAADREEISKRLLNLGLVGATAALTAATWYWRNLDPVLDYLTNYGYGTQSQYYGAEHAFLSWGRFRSVFDRMIFDDLLLPFAALIALGLLYLAYLGVRRVIVSTDRRAALLRLAGSEPLLVAIIFVTGYGALMTSQNGGNGFTYPLTALLPPLAVIALRHLKQPAVTAAVTLTGAVAALNLVANSNVSDGLSRMRFVDLPVLGGQPWIGGVPHAIAALRVQIPGPETHFEERDKGWPVVDERLANLLIQPIGPEGYPPVVAFASRNRLISTNSVGLAALLKYHRGIPFTQLTAEPSDTVGNYVRELSDPALPEQTALVTTSSNAGDFPPLVTQSHAEAAARRLGFRRLRTIRLPDGRKLRVWLKGEPGADRAVAP
ncbi:MAG TPA: hypothetical protein VFC52_03495 [Solirubrobacterales bacterium]|nr:hypothetical protein [Solirubrobacterales bacterium]